MRILLVAHHHIDRKGGVGGITLALRDAMQAAGHTVEVFGFAEAFGNGSERSRRFLFPLRVAAFIRRNRDRFDVVDATTGDAWIWLALRTGGPTVVTRSHGLEHVAYRTLIQREPGTISWRYRLYSGGYRLWEVRRSVVGADGVIMSNRTDLAYATGHWRLNANRVTVFENAAAEPIRHLAPPSRESSGSQPIALAFIGSWIRRKGVEEVVSMATTLASSGVPFSLRILGTGRAAESVLAEFTPEARPFVTVQPHYEPADLPGLLAGAHLLVHPSWSEGYSVALVEGMACGLCPIATDAGGAVDLIGDTAGVIVRSPTGSGLAGIVTGLDRDRERLHALRTAARAAALAMSWTDIAARTLAFYDTLGRR